MRKIKWFGMFAVTIIAAGVFSAAYFQSPAQMKKSLREGECKLNANAIAGTYTHAAFGTILPGNPLGIPPGPYNAVAISTLYSDGTYKLTSKTMYNGGPAVEENIEGTFTIDGCGTTFFAFGGLPTVFTYSTPGDTTIHGVSLIPGTNTTYFITRK